MRDTKEGKRKENKIEKKKEDLKGKHKTKATVGDIIFRVLIILAIFFIVLIAYMFYLQGIK